jgi:hypothetical protein
MRTARVVLALAVVSAAWTAGCGRPSLPGEHLAGREVVTTVAPERSSPLPAKPYLEWGDSDARVRILAFFLIDDRHKPLMDLFKGLAEQYRGKVYIKYVDYRTPEGQGTLQATKAAPDSLMINKSNEFEIRAKPHPYTIQFSQEIGRYWTADDLKAAVAQAVSDAYAPGRGKPAPGRQATSQRGRGIAGGGRPGRGGLGRASRGSR